MNSERRRADIPGIETPDTSYTNPELEWDNPNTEGSVASQPDAQALDEAFQEEENPVDRQLGIISRISG